MNPAITLFIYATVMIGLSLLFMQLSWRTRLRRERQEYEELKREHPERVFGTPEYQARFDQPDFAALEAHLERPLPPDFKALYQNRDTVSNQLTIALPTPAEGTPATPLTLNFFPADQMAIEDLWPVEELDTKQVPFAVDQTGSMYFLELQGEDEQNPPVYASNFEDGTCRRLTESLTQFLALRQN